MAEADVVFQRTTQSDDGSDIWDDSALIKAYDNAIRVMKSSLPGQNSLSQDSNVDVQNASSKKNKRNRRKHRTKQNEESNPGKTSKSKQWTVGSSCYAVYTEDSETYEAVIKSIDPVKKTCIVRYEGYGNEEEKQLQELIHPQNESSRRRIGNSTSLKSPASSKSCSEREVDSGMEWLGSSPHNDKKKHHKAHSGFWPPMPPFPSGSSLPPYMPNPYPGTLPGFPGFQGPTPSLNFPPVPPPPVHDISEDIVDDKEALYSMLISWYMSGYHTGYFQGLKSAKKSADVNVSQKNTPKR